MTPAYSDGRLPQGYNVGPYTFYDGNPQPYGFVLPDGSANIGWQFGFLGTAVGDMAWPGMALAQLYARTRDRRYLDAAVRIGTWITTNTWSTQPLGGFSFGVNGSNVSGAQRADRAQHRLRRVLHDPAASSRTTRRWSKAADHARAFVARMWNPGPGPLDRHQRRRRDQQVPRTAHPAYLELAGPARHRYAGALDWAGSALAVTDDASAPTSQLPDGNGSPASRSAPRA